MTSNQGQNLDRLVATIAEAFPELVLSSKMFIDPTDLWTAYPDHKEFEAEMNGLTWKTMPPDLVELHAGALRFMNPDAFVATLPAYLTALVRGTQNELPVLVLSQLTRQPGYFEKFDARLVPMTVLQRAAVTRVLEALSSTDRFRRFYPEVIGAALETWRALQ